MRPALHLVCALFLTTATVNVARAAGPGSTQPAQTAPAVMTADMPAAPGWTKTDFAIERGKCYHLTATGTWTGSDGQPTGPNGVCPDDLYNVLGVQHETTDEQRAQYYVGQHPRDALIGLMGTSRFSVLVGKEVTFLAPNSGLLSFRINDDKAGQSSRSGQLRLTFSEVTPHWLDKDGYATISARIDVSDFLHLTPDGPFWEWGGSYGRPGENAGRFPTIINGIFTWENWKTRKLSAPAPIKELWNSDTSKIRLINFESAHGAVDVKRTSDSEVVLHFAKSEGNGAVAISATLNFKGKGDAAPASSSSSALVSGGAAPAVPDDPNAIEFPSYRHRIKTLAKSISTIHGMEVSIQDDGSFVGNANDIIGTVPGDSRESGKSEAIFVRKGEGEQMQTSFDEAIRAVKLRYPKWENGKIELSFGDKYTPRDGGSAGTAFGVLLLSLLEGYDIDPRFAVTGDITVDWKVRKVGGVPAKLAGATTDGCDCAAIPESNQSDIDDLRLISGDAALWNIQVFSIGTLQQASALLRTPHEANVAEAIKLFSATRDLWAKNAKLWLHNPALHKNLIHVLELCPNHLSAKHLLAAMDGTAPTTLSLEATVQQYNSITYLYREINAGKVKLNRMTLPPVRTVATRHRLAVLHAIADHSYLPLMVEFGNFAEFIDRVADGKGTIDQVKTRFEALAAQEEALDVKENATQ